MCPLPIAVVGLERVVGSARGNHNGNVFDVRVGRKSALDTHRLTRWPVPAHPHVAAADELSVGTVKLTSTTATCGVFAMPNASGRCHGVPGNERARAQESMIAGAKPMSSNIEQVAHDVK